MFAADVGAGERQIVAQEVAEQQARLDAALIFLAVRRQCDVVKSMSIARPLVSCLQCAFGEYARDMALIIRRGVNTAAGVNH